MKAYLRSIFFYSAIFALFFISAIFGFTAPAFAHESAMCPFVWDRNLREGTTGDDVLMLQKYLNEHEDTAVASSGPGSKGLETKRFGGMTKLAVIKLQEKYAADILIPNGLTKGTGTVGASTRAKLNVLCSKSAGEVHSATTSVVEPSLVVTIPEQPRSIIAPANALYIPFTVVTFTAEGGDVTINKIVVERAGPSSDRAVSYVSLMGEDGFEHTYGYLSSNHTVTLKEPIEIPAGTSQTFTVAGNMVASLTDYDAQLVYLQIKSIEASAPVKGVFPVVGTPHTTNSSLAIGSVSATLSSLDPGTARTRYIMETGTRFSGIRITAGSQEDVKLTSITWNEVGTAGPSDIANVKTIINDVSYVADADGDWYTTSFPDGGLLIKKGESLDLSVVADLLPTAANRTVRFNIHYPTDLYLYGQSYGYGIYLVPGGNTDTTGNSVFLTSDGTTAGTSLYPFFSGSVTTVNPGTATSITR